MIKDNTLYDKMMMLTVCSHMQDELLDMWRQDKAITQQQYEILKEYCETL